MSKITVQLYIYIYIYDIKIPCLADHVESILAKDHRMLLDHKGI